MFLIGLFFPADITQLGTRPWTLITSMFVHNEVMAVLPAMAWLGVFGYVLQDLTGNRKLVPIYIYGGLSGSSFISSAIILFPNCSPACLPPPCMAPMPLLWP